MTSKFDKERVAHIQGCLEGRLRSLGTELSVQFTVGHASFSETNCRIQLDVDVIRDGKVVSQEAEDWKRYATMYKIHDVDVGYQFEHHELGKCEVVGWSRRKRKFPVIFKQVSTGERFKISGAAFKAILGFAKREAV